MGQKLETVLPSLTQGGGRANPNEVITIEGATLAALQRSYTSPETPFENVLKSATGITIAGGQVTIHSGGSEFVILPDSIDPSHQWLLNVIRSALIQPLEKVPLFAETSKDEYPTLPAIVEIAPVEIPWTTVERVEVFSVKKALADVRTFLKKHPYLVATSPKGYQYLISRDGNLKTSLVVRMLEDLLSDHRENDCIRLETYENPDVKGQTFLRIGMHTFLGMTHFLLRKTPQYQSFPASGEILLEPVTVEKYRELCTEKRQSLRGLAEKDGIAKYQTELVRSEICLALAYELSAVKEPTFVEKIEALEKAERAVKAKLFGLLIRVQSRQAEIPSVLLEHWLLPDWALPFDINVLTLVHTLLTTFDTVCAEVGKQLRREILDQEIAKHLAGLSDTEKKLLLSQNGIAAIYSSPYPYMVVGESGYIPDMQVSYELVVPPHLLQMQANVEGAVGLQRGQTPSTEVQKIALNAAQLELTVDKMLLFEGDDNEGNQQNIHMLLDTIYHVFLALKPDTEYEELLVERARTTGSIAFLASLCEDDIETIRDMFEREGQAIYEPLQLTTDYPVSYLARLLHATESPPTIQDFVRFSETEEGKVSAARLTKDLLYARVIGSMYLIDKRHEYRKELEKVLTDKKKQWVDYCNSIISLFQKDQSGSDKEKRNKALTAIKRSCVVLKTTLHSGQDSLQELHKRVGLSLTTDEPDRKVTDLQAYLFRLLTCDNTELEQVVSQLEFQLVPPLLQKPETLA